MLSLSSRSVLLPAPCSMRCRNKCACINAHKTCSSKAYPEIYGYDRINSFLRARIFRRLSATVAARYCTRALCAEAQATREIIRETRRLHTRAHTHTHRTIVVCMHIQIHTHSDRIYVAFGGANVLTGVWCWLPVHMRATFQKYVAKHISVDCFAFECLCVCLCVCEGVLLRCVSIKHTATKRHI